MEPDLVNALKSSQHKQAQDTIIHPKIIQAITIRLQTIKTTPDITPDRWMSKIVKTAFLELEPA